MKLALRLALLAIVLGLATLMAWRSREASPSPAAAPADAETPLELAPSESDLPAPESDGPATAEGTTERELAPSPALIDAPLSSVGTATMQLLRVRVVSKERGEPLAGRRVSVREKAARNWHSAHVDGSRAAAHESPLTDAEGRAELEVGAGVELRLWAEDQYSGATDLPAFAPLEVRELTLEIATEPDLTVFGRIVDAETNVALPDALVSFAAHSNARVKAPGDAPVSRDGVFELHARSWKQRFASASAEGYARVIFALVEGHATRDHALEVRLSRAAAVEVSVLDSGRAASGVEVELATESYRLQQNLIGTNFFWSGDDPTWSGFTEADGRVEIRDLPPRVPLTLSARLPGGELRTEGAALTLEPGELRAIEILLGAGATIVGRIEDGAGVAVAGCEIWRATADVSIPQILRSYSEPVARTSSDGQGRFRFDDVPVGTWLVGPKPISSWDQQAKTMDAPVGLAQVAQVDAGASQVEVVLRIDRGLYLSGRVLGPDGAPVAGCAVNASGKGMWEGGNTDDSGAFKLGPLIAGSYSVQAGGVFGKYAKSESVAAHAGDADIVLRVALGGSMVVHVVDASGTPRTCDVVVSRSGDESGWFTSSAQKGTARFEGLSTGGYAVSARTSDGLFGQRSQLAVRAGEVLDPVEVVLEPGAKLKLRYDGAGELAGYDLVSDGENFWSDGLPRGTEALCVVPAGALEVRWRLPPAPGFASQRITLVAGEERELVWSGKP